MSVKLAAEGILGEGVRQVRKGPLYGSNAKTGKDSSDPCRFILCGRSWSVPVPHATLMLVLM